MIKLRKCYQKVIEAATAKKKENQEKNKMEKIVIEKKEEKKMDGYGIKLRIMSVAENLRSHARNVVVGAVFFSLPFFGVYAAQILHSPVRKAEYVKAEEKIIEKNKQKDGLENLVRPYEALVPEKNLVLVFKDVPLYKCSSSAKPYLDEAVFWHQEVFPPFSLGEKISFCREIDSDDDFFISMYEAKKFLDKIKNEYEQEVRCVWKELKK